jgi:subtilisin family serine protease
MRVVRAAFVLAGLAAFLALGTGASAGPGKGAAPTGLERFGVPEAAEFVPGELLVRFQAGVSSAGRTAALSSVGARVERSLLLPGLYVARLPEQASVRAAEALLERDARVLRATPNYLYLLSARFPNDPRFPDLWGLHNAADHDVDAPDAWARTQGSRNVVVAVVDSGVAYTHPDLAPNIWTNPGEIPNNNIDDDENELVDDVVGFDFVDFDNRPTDPNGHGTHVAGTIGANGNDSLGVVGVNWRVQIMPVRAGDATGSLPLDAIVNSLFYSGLMGADVVNGSFGGGSPSAEVQDVIRLFPDTLFVFAAGNDGENNDSVETYPCNYAAANIVCVGASDGNDRLTGFSNFGVGNVDLAAPGADILSAWPAFDTLFSDNHDDGGLGPQWVAGKSSGLSWNGTTEAKKSGTHSAADSPGALYQNNTNSWIDLVNPIDLAERTGCALDYELRLQSETGFDGLLIDVSTDGGASWETIDGWSGSTAGFFFRLATDLSLFDGGNVLVRFRFVSDEAIVFDGAHVDDVAVRCLSEVFDANDYMALDGTSMATPHVAGVAALVLAANSRLSTAALKSVILRNVDKIPALDGLVATGGRLNANRAVTAALPRVRINDVALVEGDRGTKVARFNVTLNIASGNDVTVTFKTANGTARAPSDYVAKGGKVTFTPGQRTKTVTVAVKGDRRREPNETFFVKLSRPVNAILADASGRGLIRNND